MVYVGKFGVGTAPDDLLYMRARLQTGSVEILIIR